VIICEKYLVGIETKRSYKVLKENLIFGIRCPQDDPSYVPNGIIHNDKVYSELWAIYDNETRLLVEL